MMTDCVDMWQDVDGLELFLDDFVNNFEDSWYNATERDSPHSDSSAELQRNYKGSRAGPKTKKVIKATTKRLMKAPVLPLIAFPSYDRHDSLVYFPNKMVKLQNCGDHAGLSTLLNRYTHRDCQFYIDRRNRNNWHLDQVLEMFATAADMHPDSINCVHSTHVNGNVIDTTMYFKFTDSADLSKYLQQCTCDPFVHLIVARSRGENLKQLLQLEDKTAEEQERMGALADSIVDLTVYGKADVSIVFDDISKKIVKFVYEATFTSIEAKLPVVDAVQVLHL
jgi:hypothetical protein